MPTGNRSRDLRLRYVTDASPGIRRRMGRLGFEYVRANGSLIRMRAELERIRALAVPPAWTDVWICPDPAGHIQATGRDARGRKQYRYHVAWRAWRDDTKYDRLESFAARLPAIRARTHADLATPGLPREKVLATVVQLLDRSFIRVGNDEYAKANGSFGLTTMRDGHVDVRGGTLRFQFRGKSGKRHAVDVNDRRLARIVGQCRDLPGQELFQYLGDDGVPRDVTSSDVNAYLREITGEEITAKDFRTWWGTVLAVSALRELPAPPSAAQAKAHVVRAIEAVAGLLGNTPAVCRKSYIHPVVVSAYMEGRFGSARLRTPGRGATGLREDERAALALLRARNASAGRGSGSRRSCRPARGTVRRAPRTYPAAS